MEDDLSSVIWGDESPHTSPRTPIQLARTLIKEKRFYLPTESAGPLRDRESLQGLIEQHAAGRYGDIDHLELAEEVTEAGWRQRTESAPSQRTPPGHGFNGKVKVRTRAGGISQFRCVCGWASHPGGAEGNREELNQHYHDESAE